MNILGKYFLSSVFSFESLRVPIYEHNKTCDSVRLTVPLQSQSVIIHVLHFRNLLMILNKRSTDYQCIVIYVLLAVKVIFVANRNTRWQQQTALEKCFGRFCSANNCLKIQRVLTSSDNVTACYYCSATLTLPIDECT